MTYTSFLDVVSQHIQTCLSTDPGSVEINGEYVRVSNPVTPIASQYGVYWLNQKWPGAYVVNHNWYFTDVKANLNYTDTDTSKAMLFMSYMDNNQTGVQIFELYSSLDKVICRNDPQDKKIPS